MDAFPYYNGTQIGTKRGKDTLVKQRFVASLTLSSTLGVVTCDEDLAKPYYVIDARPF